MSTGSTSTDIDWKQVLWFLEIVIVVGGLIWAAAFLRADVNNNTKWNERQDSEIESHKERVRGTYVRQDVAKQRYQNLIDKLEAIDQKLD